MMIDLISAWKGRGRGSNKEIRDSLREAEWRCTIHIVGGENVWTGREQRGKER